MYQIITNLIENMRLYYNYLIFGGKDEYELSEIYKKNEIDVNKIYIQLKNINKIVAREKDYNKILNFLKREIKYEEQLANYENILDLELETCDKVKKIELMTIMNSLKKSFEKIINIKNEYYKETKNKKTN